MRNLERVTSVLGIALLSLGLLSMAPAIVMAEIGASCNAQARVNLQNVWSYSCVGFCYIEGGTQQQMDDKCGIDAQTAATGYDSEGNQYRFCGCDGVEPTCCHTRIMTDASQFPYPVIAEGSCAVEGCPDPPDCDVTIYEGEHFAECTIEV